MLLFLSGWQERSNKLVVEAEVDAPTVRSDGTLLGEGDARICCPGLF